MSQSDGISGEYGEDDSCGAFPETSSADDSAVATEAKDSQQATSSLRGVATKAQMEALIQLLPQQKRLPDKLLPQVTAQAQIKAQGAQASPPQESINHSMQVAMKILTELSYVERFAWFAVPWSSAQPASNLVDEFGSIAPVETAYAALSIRRHSNVDGRFYAFCQMKELDA